MGCCPQGGFDGDPTAHAARREVRPCLHEFRDISTVTLDGAFGCCARTLPHVVADRRRPQVVRPPGGVACDEVMDESHFHLRLDVY